jgi:hypothetical protein
MMELILDLVLEQADVMTLLDCLFLSKHVHEVVMRILYVEFKLIRRFSELLRGEVYPGIKYFSSEFYLSHLQDYHSWYEKTQEFEELQAKYAENAGVLTDRMMTIYGRLYKFKINPKADYINDSDFEECEVFVDDFMEYLRLYHHKVSRKVLGCLVWNAYRRGRCYELINILIEKGFDINQLLYIGGIRQTILHFCVYRELWSIVDTLLDTCPDLYVYDKNGTSVYRLIKQYVGCPQSVLDKFQALVKQQKHNRLRWHTVNKN